MGCPPPPPGIPSPPCPQISRDVRAVTFCRPHRPRRARPKMPTACACSDSACWRCPRHMRPSDAAQPEGGGGRCGTALHPLLRCRRGTDWRRRRSLGGGGGGGRSDDGTGRPRAHRPLQAILSWLCPVGRQGLVGLPAAAQSVVGAGRGRGTAGNGQVKRPAGPQQHQPARPVRVPIAPSMHARGNQSTTMTSYVVAAEQL